jgi:hypothetical protein
MDEGVRIRSSDRLETVQERLEKVVGEDLGLVLLNLAARHKYRLVGYVKWPRVVASVNRGMVNSGAPIFDGELRADGDGCVLVGRFRLAHAVRILSVAMAVVAGLMAVGGTWAAITNLDPGTALFALFSLVMVVGVPAFVRTLRHRASHEEEEILEVLRSALDGDDARDGDDDG